MAIHGDMRGMCQWGGLLCAGRLGTIDGLWRASHRSRPQPRQKTIPIASTISKTSSLNPACRFGSGTPSVYTIGVSIHSYWILGEVPESCE